MKSLDRLIVALKRFPGVGPKQAERLAIHLLRAPDAEIQTLVEALRDVKASIGTCRQCFDFTDREPCKFCADAERERALLCVVEEPQDVSAIERSRGYKGLYHVLHGALSPLEGVGPDSLRLKELVARVARGGVSEVILATDPDTEGEATAHYISQLLKPYPVKVSRIAHGVPLGGDLDYIDERTLSHAMTGRREV